MCYIRKQLVLKAGRVGRGAMLKLSWKRSAGEDTLLFINNVCSFQDALTGLVS